MVLEAVGLKLDMRLGVKNFRRLKHVPPINFSKLTLLLGRNSSGKSSFLRIFPLLRQSLMTRISSPILWWGDLVDFGSYDGTVSDNRTSTGITFMFQLESVLERSRNPYRNHNRMLSNVDLEIKIGEIEKQVRIKEFSISLNVDSSIFRQKKVRFETILNDAGVVTGLSINDQSVTEMFEKYVLGFQTGSIFPESYSRLKADFSDTNSSILAYRFDVPLAERFSQELKPLLDKRMSNIKLAGISAEILSVAEPTAAAFEGLSQSINIRSVSKYIKNLKEGEKVGLAEKLFFFYFANRYLDIVSSIFSSMRQITSAALYIGPMRARSERYYRYQDLAVSEIDPDGKNFPMFLNALSRTQRASFSKWVQERFGYGVEVSQQQGQGHISINLTVGKTISNVVDNGYGISQILPVLGQIWWASARHSPQLNSRNKINKETLLFIEQPELHLHPAHQALIADALAETPRPTSNRADSNNVRFVVETHSEALVNRIGQLIATKKIKNKDVNVLIFEPDPKDDRSTQVRVAEFDSEGVLINWPYDFFIPNISA